MMYLRFVIRFVRERAFRTYMLREFREIWRRSKKLSVDEKRREIEEMRREFAGPRGRR
jgi:hypothetical protein